jgi:hypothetical protein
LVKDAQVVLINIVGLDAIVKKKMEHNPNEGGIPRQVCNNFANHLPMRNVSLLE